MPPELTYLETDRSSIKATVGATEKIARYSPTHSQKQLFPTYLPHFFPSDALYLSTTPLPKSP